MRRRRSGALTAALVVVAVCAGVGLLAGLYLDTRENVETRCADAAPIGTAVSETALRSAEFIGWPVGRRCTWDAARGGVLTTQTGWDRTLVFSAVTAAAAGLAVVGVRRRSVVALSPLAICAAVWAVAGLCAAS